MALSKCMFCGSTAFGRGCPFSPHKYHVHPNNGKRCIYCNSMARGAGCPFNPFGRMHVHGIDFNQMVTNSVKNTIVGKYLIEKLSTPITETSAYKLGLINKQGKKIKKPETIEEINALTILDEYIINIQQMLGDKIKLIGNSIYLNHQDKEINLESFKQQYEKEYNLQKKLENIFNNLSETINESLKSGLSPLTIEKTMLNLLQ